MNETASTIDNRLPGFRPGDHVLLPYHCEDDRDAVLGPYFREGLARGERCAYAAPPSGLQGLERRLRAGGVDVDRAIERGALILHNSDSIYRPEGAFDADRTINLIRERIDVAVAEGFTGLRGAGEFAFPMTAQLGESARNYETRLNEVTDHYPFTALCAYCRADVSTAMAMVHNHPVTLLDGERCENPFYLSRGAMERDHGAMALDEMLAHTGDWNARLAQQERRIEALVNELARQQAAEIGSYARRRTRSVRKELQTMRRSLRDGVSPPAGELLRQIERVWSEVARLTSAGDDAADEHEPRVARAG